MKIKLITDLQGENSKRLCSKDDFFSLLITNWKYQHIFHFKFPPKGIIFQGIFNLSELKRKIKKKFIFVSI